jgi:hypothetical protein
MKKQYFFILGLTVLLGVANKLLAQNAKIAMGKIVTKEKAMEQQIQSDQSQLRLLTHDWIRARLKTVLYNDRYLRAYQHWIHAPDADQTRDEYYEKKAQNLFFISIENRKIAWYKMQDAQHRLSIDKRKLSMDNAQEQILKAEVTIDQLNAKIKSYDQKISK